MVIISAHRTHDCIVLKEYHGEAIESVFGHISTMVEPNTGRSNRFDNTTTCNFNETSEKVII